MSEAQLMTNEVPEAEEESNADGSTLSSVPTIALDSLEDLQLAIDEGMIALTAAEYEAAALEAEYAEIDAEWFEYCYYELHMCEPTQLSASQQVDGENEVLNDSSWTVTESGSSSLADPCEEKKFDRNIAFAGFGLAFAVAVASIFFPPVGVAAAIIQIGGSVGGMALGLAGFIYYGNATNNCYAIQGYQR